jgi:hypothetical protein
MANLKEGKSPIGVLTMELTAETDEEKALVRKWWHLMKYGPESVFLSGGHIANSAIHIGIHTNDSFSKEGQVGYLIRMDKKPPYGTPKTQYMHPSCAVLSEEPSSYRVGWSTFDDAETTLQKEFERDNAGKYWDFKIVKITITEE